MLSIRGVCLSCTAVRAGALSILTAEKSSEFTTRKEAVAKAKRELTEGKGDLFIFDKSGRSVLRRQHASLNGVFNRLRVRAFFQRIRFRMGNLYRLVIDD